MAGEDREFELNKYAWMRTWRHSVRTESGCLDGQVIVFDVGNGR